MNLKLLLQAICLCKDCKWLVTYAKQHYLSVYPQRVKNIGYDINYVFYSTGYAGFSRRRFESEIDLTPEQVEYVIKHGVKDFLAKN